MSIINPVIFFLAQNRFLQAFSISGIAGAYCDEGQNYKNLIELIKELGKISYSYHFNLLHVSVLHNYYYRIPWPVQGRDSLWMPKEVIASNQLFVPSTSIVIQIYIIN